MSSIVQLFSARLEPGIRQLKVINDN